LEIVHESVRAKACLLFGFRNFLQKYLVGNLVSDIKGGTQTGGFENRVLRTFGLKRDEVTGEWRKLHNEELHDLYSSPSIIRIIKARRMRWRRETCIGCWWESQREGGY
jgi:hypothetical protein